MERIKILLMPGCVISSTGGDRHLISSTQLKTLYGLSSKFFEIKGWYIYEETAERFHDDIDNYGDYIKLYPLFNGNYKKILLNELEEKYSNIEDMKGIGAPVGTDYSQINESLEILDKAIKMLSDKE